MAFLHGVSTKYIDIVPRPVQTVPSNVIALIGTTPTYRLDAENVTINEPQRCIGDIDDARYAGPKTDGFTIPHALDIIRDNEGGTVIIINVFDPDVHKTTATAITYTVTSNTLQLEQTTGTTRIADTRAEGLTGTFAIAGSVEDTDYTVDTVTGIVTRITGGNISIDDDIDITYTWADPSLVTPSEIVGSVVNGQKTGLQSVKDFYNLFGFTAKLLIAPIYSEDGEVAAEMEALTGQTKAYAFIDAPAGVTRDEAIAGRSGTAPVATFAASNSRVGLCYPRMYTSDGRLFPLSAFAAGVTAGTDRNKGYWFSPSNKIIQGLDKGKGLELRLSGDFTSADTDINALNAAGIITVLANGFGQGFRLWGNRSSIYPSDTSPLNFISVQRTVDITVESIQRASLSYLDEPITAPWIDRVLAGGNAYLREQIQSGALVTGSELLWLKQNNSESVLAAGKSIFSILMMVPVPAENIVYEYSLDIDLLNNILPTTEAA